MLNLWSFQFLGYHRFGTMAGETGGTGRDPPLLAPLISLPGWDPGDQYITKMDPFYFSWTVFSNCNSCIGGFGPFETLEEPFPRGGGGPEPSPPTSGIISPALVGTPRQVPPPPPKTGGWIRQCVQLCDRRTSAHALLFYLLFCWVCFIWRLFVVRFDCVLLPASRPFAERRDDTPWFLKSIRHMFPNHRWLSDFGIGLHSAGKHCLLRRHLSRLLAEKWPMFASLKSICMNRNANEI